MASITKEYDPLRDGPKVQITPDVPELDNKKISTVTKKTKAATPDLILFQEKLDDQSQLARLLFEKIGGVELLTIARSDIINGQQISYSLISNSSQIERTYGATKLIALPGSTNEYFKNFGIAFVNRVPPEGTGPLLYYVGALNSVVSCAGYPILNSYTNEYVACVTVSPGQQSAALTSAQALAAELSPPRNIVYSDPETGDLVIDVTNMETNDKVQIELLQTGDVENDTIY